MTSAPAVQQASEAAPNVTSAWSPLKNGLFRSLWIATIVSNMGTWMQDVGAGWLMTSLSSSPSLVALVEAADSLPIMLLALPAGAIADIVDRRRLLIAAQVYLMVIAGALGLLTWLNVMTPWMLLGFMFALGVGAAMVMPAWAAIVPELVPPEDLPSAIALNSIAINVSRAIGPAIAGVLVAAVGAWLVFVLNALSYIGILAVLAAMATAAAQELAARRALRQRHTRRPALRHAYARAADRADPRKRIFRVRECDMVAVSADRSARTGDGPGNLRPAPHLYRYRRGWRGAAAATRARARFSRDALVAGASTLYAVAALDARAMCRTSPCWRWRCSATGVAWISILRHCRCPPR